MRTPRGRSSGTASPDLFEQRATPPRAAARRLDRRPPSRGGAALYCAQPAGRRSPPLRAAPLVTAVGLLMEGWHEDERRRVASCPRAPDDRVRRHRQAVGTRGPRPHRRDRRLPQRPARRRRHSRATRSSGRSSSGHEGAGVVEAVGDDVTTRAARRSRRGLPLRLLRQLRPVPRRPPQPLRRRHRRPQRLGPPRLSQNGQALWPFAGIGSYAERMLLHENSVVKIDPDLPLDRAALVGCGVLTGVGAALRTAGLEAGQTVAVFGCGGVGLSIVQGARIGGARQIIALDLFDSKLEMARRVGATHVVNTRAGRPRQGRARADRRRRRRSRVRGRGQRDPGAPGDREPGHPRHRHHRRACCRRTR